MTKRRFGAAPRGGLPILIGQIVAALAVVAWLLHAQGVQLPFTGEDPLRISVAFTDAGGLRTDQRAPVLVSGVPSGRVERVEQRDGTAVATLRLDPAARGVVKRDAVATIEPRSALQDLTVDLDPGSPSAPAARDGDRLPPSQGRGPVELDRVVAVLDADTRAQVALALGQLATAATARPGALRDAIAQLRPAIGGAGQVAAQLDHRRTQLARLVTAVDRLAGAAGTQDQALRRAVAAARRTADAIAGRDAELKQAIGRLPGTLRHVQTALSATRRLGRDLDPAVRALRPTARDLPAALEAARETVPQASRVVAELDRLTRQAPAIRRLRRLSTDLVPVLRTLVPAAGNANTILREVDERKGGVRQLGENFSGVLSTNDALGPVLRGLGSFEPFDPVDVGFPRSQRARAAATAVRALTRVCERDNQLACLVRYLVPGLPGAVRK